MKWLLRRVLVMWLMLVIVCIGGVAVGRLDHTPNTLQELGFGLCDGEACFRGIKLGTDWQTVHRVLPQAAKSYSVLELLIRPDTMRIVRVGVEAPGVNVKYINIEAVDANQPLRLTSITAGNIIAQYGAPCRLYLTYMGADPFQMVFIYPTLVVSAYVVGDHPRDAGSLRLQPNSPLGNFSITKVTYYGDCEHGPLAVGGDWQGFTSPAVYRARFLRASRSKQP